MRQLEEKIDAPELGAKIDGLEGTLIRVPRHTSFQADPDGCIRERRVIIEWCREQEIGLARLDMARMRPAKDSPLRAMPRPHELEWEAFVLGGSTAAVAFKVRWA